MNQVVMQCGAYIAQCGEIRACCGYHTPYAVFKKLILKVTIRKPKIALK